jgi:peptide/nickel transport system substrate-binding protein
MTLFTRRSVLGSAAGAAVSLASVSRADTPNRGGSLHMILNPEPPTLAMALAPQVPVQLVAGKVIQGLLTYDAKLKPLPVLAKSWGVSADGLTWTFHLQSDVLWHDGKPFTADDVIFSITKYLPELSARARGNFANIAEATAPNPLTVVFRLKQPFMAFLYALDVIGGGIVPRHLYEGTDFRKNPSNLAPVGTGPFKFGEWQHGRYIRLVRNDKYWKAGLPYLDEIVFEVIPDAASRALALETGQVQIASFNDIEFFDVERVSKVPTLERTKAGYEFFSPLMWIELNHRVKPLDDRRFRQAILYAIDRSFIRDKLWFGFADVAVGAIARTTRFYDPSVEPRPFDPARAEALMDEMGLKRGPDGVRTKLKLMPLPYGEVWSRLAEYIRQSLGKVGVQVTLDPADPASWVKRLANWEYEMTISYTYQQADPAVRIEHTYMTSDIKKGVPFNNSMGYSNPEVDFLFDQARVATSDEERQKLYSKVQHILWEDVPVAWLLEMKFPTFLDKRCRDVITTGLGVVESFDSAWLAT